MNNSFSRLIDGMCATLRAEVLTRLDDDFARGQVFGVINLLNTFKVRADWSSGFLLQQIEAQHATLEGVAALLQQQPEVAATLGSLPVAPVPIVTPIAALLRQRDEANQTLGRVIAWLDDEHGRLDAGLAARIESLVRTAMRAETQIELKNSPRPLFAEMSSGTEG